jgi:hypothetical protein
MDESDRRPDAGQANSELTTELKRDVRTRPADWSALLVSADDVIEPTSRMARPVFVRSARANVKAVVLTHLNDNYVRNVEEIKKHFSGQVLIARDLMEF